MWPFRFRTGALDLGPEQVFVFLAIVVAAIVARRRMAPLGISNGDLLDLALAAFLGGAVGAKLFYALPLWIRGTKSAGELASRWSDGSGFYGGLILACAACAAVLRLKRKPLGPSMDAGSTAIPLGFAIGKIGCFLAGCCYGRRCDGFPGVPFAPDSLAFETQKAAHEVPPGAQGALPVQPTQLYEIVFGLLLFAGATWLHRKSRRQGETFLAVIGGYSLWRFAIEFFRDDPDRHVFGAAGLSDSQITALLLILIAAAGMIAIRRRPSPG